MDLEQRRICIIGPGNWGTALKESFEAASHKVVSLDRNASKTDWDEAFSEECLALVSCPFPAVESVIDQLSKVRKLSGVLNASKGIDRKSMKTFSPLAEQKISAPIATLSGPSFAAELIQKKPTACVIAGRDAEFVSSLCDSLGTAWFRLYAHSDPVGVELCGSLKNVLAIACGISDALKLGLNARAALLSRALVEMFQLVEALGGRPATALGLAGVGDLWLTATGDLSRNRRLGLALGAGKNIQEALRELKTVEGYYTAQQVFEISKRQALDLPISQAVYRICYESAKPELELQRLMSRSLKIEESSLWQLSQIKPSTK